MLLKKSDNALLEGLVADGQHVVAALDVESLGVRHQGGQFVGRTADIVLGADGNQRRLGDARNVGLGQQFPRGGNAGGQRPAVAAGLVGEGAERAAARMLVAGSSARRAAAIGSQSPTPSTMPTPRPPKISVATLFGSESARKAAIARPSSNP